MDIDSLDIQFYDPVEATDKFLNKVFDFGDEINKERDPDEPPIPRDLRLMLVRKPHPHNTTLRWVSIKNDEVIASANISYPTKEAPGYDKNKHIIQMGINVRKELRRKGIGSKLLVVLIEKAKDYSDVTTVFAGSSRIEGKNFIEKLGGKFSQKGAENRLRISEVPWDMIKEWNTEGEKLLENGVKVLFFEECPENILNEYVAVYKETMNQQPLGDYDGEIAITPESRRLDEKRNKEQGISWFTMATKEKDGKISGMTEMFYHPQVGHKAFQNLTGVQENYRGRGIGKWLKAKMLLWITEKYPDVTYITTGNDTTNKPMLSINDRMGFKEFESGSSYSFKLEELSKKV